MSQTFEKVLVVLSSFVSANGFIKLRGVQSSITERNINIAMICFAVVGLLCMIVGTVYEFVSASKIKPSDSPDNVLNRFFGTSAVAGGLYLTSSVASSIYALLVIVSIIMCCLRMF